jgi:phosphate uptake regulator
VNARTDNPIERPTDTPRLNALLDRHEAETKDMDDREWLRHSVTQVREILAHARDLERENTRLVAACQRAIDGDWCTPKTCVAGGCACNFMNDAINATRDATAEGEDRNG